MSASDLTLAGRRQATGLLEALRTWQGVVWLATGGWIGVLVVMIRSEYLSFGLAKYDLGNMTQAVWSTAQGRPLEITTVTGEQGNRLELHVDPILALLAPLWLVAPTPLMLAVVQIAVISTGALPVFWLARRHLGSERVAGLLALSYLASPWVAWIALEAFHPVSLAIPLFLYGFWFLENDRLVPFAVCAVLAAMTGELMGVTIAALGVWFLIARRRPVGLAIAGAGLGWSIVAVYVVVPAFAGGSSPFYGYYESLGGSPVGVIRTALTDPGAIVAALTTQRDLMHLLALGLPFAGIFLLAPGIVAVAVPQLLANGLSDSPIATSPGHHYASAILPFLFVATVYGFKRLPAERRRFAALLVLVLSLGLSIAFGTYPGSPGGMRLSHTEVSPEKMAALREAVRLVPDTAYVSATNRVALHFSARKYIHTVPVIGRAGWVVVDTADVYIPWKVAGRENPELLRTFLRRVRSNEAWEQVYGRAGVFVFRRAAPG